MPLKNSNQNTFGCQFSDTINSIKENTVEKIHEYSDGGAQYVFDMVGTQVRKMLSRKVNNPIAQNWIDNQLELKQR